MKKRILVAFVVLLGLLVAVYFVTQPADERDVCVMREPDLKSENGFFELIDLRRREVWGTPHFETAEYEAFNAPLLWLKNDPRGGFMDESGFGRSPGCEHNGEFTYRRMYDREFLLVVEIDSINNPLDDDGYLMESTLEKYHQLTYNAGSTLYILNSPEGDRYIGVSQAFERTDDTPTLPEGWVLTKHLLAKEFYYELYGDMSILRTDNFDSYQGPLPTDLDLTPYLVVSNE